MEEAEAIRQAELFKALAEPTRLRILALLRRYGGKATVRDIAKGISTVTQQDISAHLRVLRSHGIISATSRGKYSYYTAEERVLHEIVGLVTDLLPKTAAKKPAARKSA